MTDIPWPDHSERPLNTTCEHVFEAAPDVVFAAWTTGFDKWFAQAGTLALVPEAGQPYFFYNRDEWGRHPHYGRILTLQENRLLEMTWLTGNGTDAGTQGAETLLRIVLTPEGAGIRAAQQVLRTDDGFKRLNEVQFRLPGPSCAQARDSRLTLPHSFHIPRPLAL